MSSVVFMACVAEVKTSEGGSTCRSTRTRDEHTSVCGRNQELHAQLKVEGLDQGSPSHTGSQSFPFHRQNECIWLAQGSKTIRVISFLLLSKKTVYKSSRLLQIVSHKPSNNMAEIGTHPITGTVLPTEAMTRHKMVK